MKSKLAHLVVFIFVVIQEIGNWLAPLAKIFKKGGEWISFLIKLPFMIIIGVGGFLWENKGDVVEFLALALICVVVGSFLIVIGNFLIGQEAVQQLVIAFAWMIAAFLVFAFCFWGVPLLVVYHATGAAKEKKKSK